MNVLYARHWLNPQKKANIVLFSFSLLWAIFRGSVNHKPNTLSHTHTQTYSYVLTASASDISNFIGQFGFKEYMPWLWISLFSVWYDSVDFKFGSRTSNMKCSLNTIIHMAASRNFFVCKKYRANAKKSESKRERASVIYFTLRIWSHVIYIVVFPLSHWNAAGLFVILNCHRRTCVAFVLYTILCVRLNCVALSLCTLCGW